MKTWLWFQRQPRTTNNSLTQTDGPSNKNGHHNIAMKINSKLVNIQRLSNHGIHKQKIFSELNGFNQWKTTMLIYREGSKYKIAILRKQEKTFWKLLFTYGKTSCFNFSLVNNVSSRQVPIFKKIGFKRLMMQISNMYQS